jgi:hypothetical protein
LNAGQRFQRREEPKRVSSSSSVRTRL